MLFHCNFFAVCEDFQSSPDAAGGRDGKEKKSLKKMFRFGTLLILSAFLCFPLFAGGQKEAGTGQKPVVTVGFAPSPILGDSRTVDILTAAWEKAVGNKYTIEVHAVMGDNFPNAMLQNFATGQGFDVFEHWGPVDCLLAGITTDMTDLVLNDWPEYKNGLIRREIVDLWNAGGKFFMIPKEEGWKLALIYRSDWLRKLGIKPPMTIDEFKTAAYAMTKQDPDGNGKNDTYGFAIEADSTWNLGNMIFAFGADNYFDLAPSGYSTVKAYLKNDAFKKEITFLRDLYKDGVINPNSFITPNVAAEFEAGKTGMFLGEPSWIAGELDEKLGADNWSVVPAFGKLYNGGASLGISKVAEKKGKAHVKAAWEVVKALFSPEVQLTLAFGQEGVAWMKEGKSYKFIKQTDMGGNIIGNMRSDLDIYALSGVDKDPKQSYRAYDLPISGGHLNWLPNREKIERKMDAIMGKVA
ncbi:MAG: hypothetical protein AB1798_08270, partial [Spirochaetota bacterium]